MASNCTMFGRSVVLLRLLSILWLFCESAKATINKTYNGSRYDYVIVGGGLSGLVVANRLTEDSTKSVLVVEYGYLDNSTETLWPYYVQGVGVNTADTDTLLSVPQQGLGNLTFSLSVGKVLGGGSIVNGMYFDRGMRSDYDSWEELGNEGWNWQSMLGYFKKSATFTPNAPQTASEYNYTWDLSAYGNGPVKASLPPFQYPEMPTFWEALEELNVTKRQEGVLGEPGSFWVPNSIDPVYQTRSSARSAYYDPVKNRTNLHVLTGHYVRKLVLSGLTIEGVEIVSRADNLTSLAFAYQEVILSAGTVHTPHILQLSGIGPSEVLKAAGIEVLLDVPGIGANFQDHPVAYITYNMTQDMSFPNPTSLSTNASYNHTAYEEYISNRTGPYTMAHGNGAAFLPLREIAAEKFERIASAYEAQNATAYLPSIYHHPDLLAGYLAQRRILANQMRSHEAAIYELSFEGGGSAATAFQKPTSRGTISLNPLDPFGEPLVDFQVMVNPTDVEIIVEAVRYTRRVYNTSAISQYGPVEVLPGAQYQTDSDIFAALTAGVLYPTFANPGCSCQMMPRELGGVVSSDLLVYGVKKLSIVDASIMPIIPATHLQATVYAIAEKAADIIKGRADEAA